MFQNIYSNNYKNNICFIQTNKLDNLYTYNKEVFLRRIKRKKSVTFNPNICIIDVESWKKYNDDVADETEYMRHKREKAYFRKNENNEKFEEKDYCNCNIF